MLMTNKGQMVRTRVKEIRETGRNTMGVKLMDLRNGERLPAIAPLPARRKQKREPPKRRHKNRRLAQPFWLWVGGHLAFPVNGDQAKRLEAPGTMPVSRGLISATHPVRRCCRCLRRRRGRRCDSSLARRGGSRLRLAGTGDQHQTDNGQRRTKYNCFFHSMNCFFKRPFVAGSIVRRI